MISFHTLFIYLFSCYLFSSSSYVYISGGNSILETFAVTDWSFQYLGNFHAANSIVTGIDSVIAGVNLTFTVQAYDQFGYIMSTYPVSFKSVHYLYTFYFILLCFMLLVFFISFKISISCDKS